MKLPKLPKLVFPVLAATLLPSSSLMATTLIMNNFDGDDSNDLGGALVPVSNGLEDVDNSDLSTGLISFQDDGNSNPAVGFTSSIAADFSSFSGFTVEWVVASGLNTADIRSNGWFFGVQDAIGSADTGSTLWNNDPDAIGVTLLRGGAATGTTNADFAESLGANGAGENFTSVGSLTNAVVEDGFTISFTLNSDETWSVSSIGLDSGSGELSGSGTLDSGSYAGLADNLFASSVFQINSNPAGVVSGGQFTSVTVTGIPEPSSVALLSLAALAGFARRRR